MRSRSIASGQPAVLAAMLTGLFAGTLLAWNLLRKLGHTRSGAAAAFEFVPRRLSQRQSLESLQQAIIGVPKQVLIEAFGPPRASAASSVPDQVPSAYWTTDTWYYSLDPAQKAALAIHFQADIARKVEFIRAPEGA